MKTFEVLENLKDWILLTSFEVFFQPRRIDVINPVTSFPRRIGGFYLILVSLILIRENLRGSWKPQRLNSPLKPSRFLKNSKVGFSFETFEVLENLKGWIPLWNLRGSWKPQRLNQPRLPLRIQDSLEVLYESLQFCHFAVDFLLAVFGQAVIFPDPVVHLFYFCGQ